MTCRGDKAIELKKQNAWMVYLFTEAAFAAS